MIGCTSDRVHQRRAAPSSNAKAASTAVETVLISVADGRAVRAVVLGPCDLFAAATTAVIVAVGPRDHRQPRNGKPR